MRVIGLGFGLGTFAVSQYARIYETTEDFTGPSRNMDIHRFISTHVFFRASLIIELPRYSSILVLCWVLAVGGGLPRAWYICATDRNTVIVDCPDHQDPSILPSHQQRQHKTHRRFTPPNTQNHPDHPIVVGAQVGRRPLQISALSPHMPHCTAVTHARRQHNDLIARRLRSWWERIDLNTQATGEDHHQLSALIIIPHSSERERGRRSARTPACLPPSSKRKKDYSPRCVLSTLAVWQPPSGTQTEPSPSLPIRTGSRLPALP